MPVDLGVALVVLDRLDVRLDGRGVVFFGVRRTRRLTGGARRDAIRMAPERLDAGRRVVVRLLRPPHVGITLLFEVVFRYTTELGGTLMILMGRWRGGIGFFSFFGMVDM